MNEKERAANILNPYFAERPAGANESELRDLAARMTTGLKAIKRGKADYWKSEDAGIERVYVKNEKGKNAGFVEMIDGKAFYREVASEDLIAVFRAARKAQKDTV